MASARFRWVRYDPSRVLGTVDAAMAQLMPIALALVERDVKQSMVGGGEPHVPSRPGEPPHVDTGDYRRRIHSVVSARRGRITGRVISGSRQAMALEFGYAPGNLAPRPHLRPALARQRAAIERVLGARVRSLVGRNRGV